MFRRILSSLAFKKNIYRWIKMLLDFACFFLLFCVYSIFVCFVWQKMNVIWFTNYSLFASVHRVQKKTKQQYDFHLHDEKLNENRDEGSRLSFLHTHVTQFRVLTARRLDVTKINPSRNHSQNRSEGFRRMRIFSSVLHSIFTDTNLKQKQSLIQKRSKQKKMNNYMIRE